MIENNRIKIRCVSFVLVVATILLNDAAMKHVSAQTSDSDCDFFGGSSSNRCGILNLGRNMYTVDSNTGACTGSCEYFYTNSILLGRRRRDNLKCGKCNDDNDDTVNDDAVVNDDTVNDDITQISECNANDDSKFDICMELLVDTQDKDAFVTARNRWTNVITGDTGPPIASSSFNGYDSPCTLPNEIDDLFVCGTIGKIDGECDLNSGTGCVLGIGGFEFLRPEKPFPEGLPIIGMMELEEADMEFMRSKGFLESVITHELGHVLGIGTLWEFRKITGPESEDCPYFGTAATREYKTINKCTDPDDVVPTQASCGHWDEDCLENELMTPVLNGGVQNPLSVITLGGLEDIGYVVDYSKADPYSQADINPLCHGCINTQRNLKISNNRKRLSPIGFIKATEIGRKILKERDEKFSTSRESKDWVYVGNLGLHVWYMEDNQIHDVWVTPE